MKIELDRLPDSNLSPNKRLHFMALYKAKAAAKMDAVMLVLAQGKPPRPYEKAHIDGLVEAGLLVDDDAMRVSYTLRYERGTRNNTIIEVEELR